MDSVVEDAELSELLLQTLDANGCTGKIRAQLRASVFLALDEDIKLSASQPLLNKKITSNLETVEGQLMFCVVREFLEFFNLDLTLSVFNPESYLGVSYEYNGRSKLSQNLGLMNEDNTVPLLLQVIRIAQQRTRKLEVNLNRDLTSHNAQNRSSEEQLEESSGSIKTNSSSTYSQTSSLHDVGLDGSNIDPFLDNTVYLSANDQSPAVISNNHENQNITYTNEPNLSPNVSSSSASDVQIKLGQKSEKSKPKNIVGSLCEIPVLTVNKSRQQGDILPSLYSQEFKDKSLSRESEFDEPENSFEEDFSLENPADLTFTKSEIIQHKSDLQHLVQSDQNRRNSLNSLSDLPLLTIQNKLLASDKRIKKPDLNDIKLFLDSDAASEIQKEGKISKKSKDSGISANLKSLNVIRKSNELSNSNNTLNGAGDNNKGNT